MRTWRGLTVLSCLMLVSAILSSCSVWMPYHNVRIPDGTYVKEDGKDYIEVLENRMILHFEHDPKSDYCRRRLTAEYSFMGADAFQVFEDPRISSYLGCIEWNFKCYFRDNCIQMESEDWAWQPIRLRFCPTVEK